MAEVELTSVPTHDARRSPRVDFNAQVELLAHDALEPTPRVIVAQALDLGAGGMGLSLRERLSIGTHVTCRLALDGRYAALAGHVAWQRAHTSPRPHGLGVCFDPLGEYERELLAHVMDRSRAEDRPVELRFGTLQTPVIARARETPHGLRVSSALPLLNRGTELAVRFQGEGQAYVGRITAVAVSEQDGTRRLEVDIALNDTGNVRFRRQARYGHADELCEQPASAEGRTLQSGSPAADDELTRTGPRAARPRKRAFAAEARVAPAARPVPAPSRTGARVLAGLRIAASLLLAVACGAGASAWVERSWHSRDAPDVAPPIALEPVEPSAEHAVDETGFVATNSPTNSPPNLAEPAAQSGATTLPQPTPGDPQPTLMLETGATVIAIPFEGSLDGMRTTTWASPAAVALDLPHGRARVAHGYFPLSGGDAAGLRVRQRGDELLVRVLLAQPVSRIAVAANGDSLEIRLTNTP